MIKGITYCTTYYNESELLYALLDNFNTSAFSRIIIVDDGSMESPAEPVVRMFPTLPITLLRIKDDLGFNSHGARNLAMRHIETEWALLTDIDMYYDESIAGDIHKTASEQNGRGNYYNFWVNDKQDYIGRCEMSHNDFLIRTDDYWISGGYDEEFTGIHYGDRLFTDRLNTYLKRTTMPNIVIDKRMGRKTVMTDTVTKTTYDDRNHLLFHPLLDAGRLKKLTDAVGYRNERRELWQRDNILQFDWEVIKL